MQPAEPIFDEPGKPNPAHGKPLRAQRSFHRVTLAMMIRRAWELEPLSIAAAFTHYDTLSGYARCMADAGFFRPGEYAEFVAMIEIRRCRLSEREAATTPHPCEPDAPRTNEDPGF